MITATYSEECRLPTKHGGVSLNRFTVEEVVVHSVRDSQIRQLMTGEVESGPGFNSIFSF